MWLDSFTIVIVQHFKAIFWSLAPCHVFTKLLGIEVFQFIPLSFIILQGVPGNSPHELHTEVLILSSKFSTIFYHLTCNLLKCKEAGFLAF